MPPPRSASPRARRSSSTAPRGTRHCDRPAGRRAPGPRGQLSIRRPISRCCRTRPAPRANPKGVMLTHRNLVANIAQIKPLLEMKASDAILAVLPFFHIYGMTVLLNAALLNRAKLVVMPRFDLGRVPVVVPEAEVQLHLHRAAGGGGIGQAPDGRRIRPLERPHRSCRVRPRWTSSSATPSRNVLDARCSRATA